MIKSGDKLDLNPDNDLITSNGYQVMMNWERPIMEKMAELVTKQGGSILEVGFGLGISAEEIQKYKITKHTIIEINQEVYQNAKNWEQSKNLNIEIIHKDFIEFLENTDEKFDGIFYDPYPSDILGVGDDNFMYGKLFFDKIKKICNPGCRVVPFLTGCSIDLQYLIEYVPLKSIEDYTVEVENVKTQYFSGSLAKVYVFNI
jgi:spermidine synthase